MKNQEDVNGSRSENRGYASGFSGGVSDFSDTVVDEGKKKIKDMTKTLEESVMGEVEYLKTKLRETEEIVRDLKTKMDVVVKEHPYYGMLTTLVLGVISASLFRMVGGKEHSK